MAGQRFRIPRAARQGVVQTVSGSGNAWSELEAVGASLDTASAIVPELNRLLARKRYPGKYRRVAEETFTTAFFSYKKHRYADDKDWQDYKLASVNGSRNCLSDGTPAIFFNRYPGVAPGPVEKAEVYSLSNLYDLAITEKDYLMIAPRSGCAPP